MFLLRKSNILKVTLFVTFTVFFTSANAHTANQKPESHVESRTYLSLFGGGGASASNNLTQNGTAFIPTADGGPLVVNANGRAGSSSAVIFGANVGYAFARFSLGKDDSTWHLSPAAEIEGYYLGNDKKTAVLFNNTPRIPGHTFIDTLPMRAGIFLTNIVLPFGNSKMGLYVGGGIGAVIMSINDANSEQVILFEPGINHFNSDPNASRWSFAAQGKVGLRINITDHWKVFAEYRLLYISQANYNFGSTLYSTHVPTSNWNINMKGDHYNIGSIGISYYL